jgi:Leucine-rich repeat (LRR) protein
MSCLRVLNARHNKIKSENVPSDLHNLEDLQVLDLSHNDLESVPTNLEEAKSILVLNLGYNKIINVPNHLFINLTDLVYLDLSNNKLEMLPPQLRRLVHLKTLILNDNPLMHAQLRQLPALVSLESLHLQNTQRTLANIPQGLENLPHLKELDLSCNNLNIIPDTVYKIKTLRRFNFSQNCASEISHLIGELDELITLNLSRNKLLILPNTLCKLYRLKKLYVNSNLLSFVGIPAGIGKLSELEIFSASDNRLEMLPEGLCRCGKLRKLILNKNRLYTLPESIHFLQLQELDVSDNPDFQMPAKPIEMQKEIGAGVLFYNIDFSLQHQLMLAGATPQQITSVTGSTGATQTPVKDPIARKKRLKLLKQLTANENDSSKVLKGMRDVAKLTKQSNGAGASSAKTDVKPEIKGKKWDEQLEKPKLDYSEFFEEDVGHIPGIVCYEIEKFLPSPVEPILNGKFHEGDCYIILKTFIDELNSLNWQIYFWIGSQSTVNINRIVLNLKAPIYKLLK